MRPLFPTVTLETLLVPADASHRSLFARFLDQQRKIRALVFNPLRILFHSLQTSDTPSRFFSITSTLFARVPGAARSPSKYAHQSAPAHPATRSRTERHNADQASELDLVAGRYVFISSHRYFLTLRRETLSDALSSYGEEIPNPPS
jgi:hypothetical protein